MNDVDVHIRGKIDGLKQAAGEAKSTIADLKDDVVTAGSQMSGVSRGLLDVVTRLPLPLLAAGAAAGVMAKAYADGAAEVRNMNLALDKTSNIAGQSAAGLRDLAVDLAAHSQLTIGQSKEVATVLAGAGQIGAGAFRQVTELAGDFARVMGTDVAKVGPELVKLFDDPAKGAEQLNQQMHFLTAAELDRIESLQRMGEVTAAQVELSGRLKERLGEIAPPLGVLERAWLSVKGAASSAWDAMMDVGRAETLKEKLAKARKDVLFLEGDGSKNLPSAKRAQMLLDARQAEMKLQDQLEAESQKQFDKSQAAEKNRQDQMARTLAKRYSKSVQAAEIDDEIKLMEKSIGSVAGAEEAIAKLREKRAKLFEEKSGPKRRDLFADTLQETSGLNRDFFDKLGALKTGLDGARISQEGYVDAVGKLIEKQPFAVKMAREEAAALKEEEKAWRDFDRATGEYMRHRERMQREANQLTHGLEAGYRKTAEGRARAAEAEAMTDSQRRLAAAMAEVNDRARAARESLDLKFPERERESTQYREAIEKIDAAQKSAAQSAAEWAARQDKLNASWETGAVRGLKAYADQADRTADNMASAFQRGAQMAEDAIANFVVKGKFDIKSLAEFAATEFARQNVARPLVSAGSNWLKGLFGGGNSMAGYGGEFSNSALDVGNQSAKGNAFASADLSRYENSIVTRPTVFAFAKGVGLMGEKPGSPGEAIMPLTRMGDGDLGVKVQGGGGAAPITVTITNHIDSRTDRASIAVMMDHTQRQTLAAIADAQRRGR